ncbi:MAG: hypothetical protein QOE70_1411 [Chthoniobacter sp.]|jgi:hypothetical protein|nr:hypothetical protein [Chthoniobacter sp.]
MPLVPWFKRICGCAKIFEHSLDIAFDALMRAAAKSFLALVVLTLPRAVHGGPPFVTDDPEPVEFRHWEILLATQQYHSAEGWNGTGPHLEVNYGPAPDVQLHVILPLAYNRPAHSLSRWGYGDTELGIKYRFLHETDSRPQIGFYPIVELPTGSHSEDLGNGKAQLLVPLWLQKKAGDWITFGGGGYWFNPGQGNHDYWFAGWSLQHRAPKVLNSGLEIQFRSPVAVGVPASVALNGGFTWDLSETSHILFSAGHTIVGRSEFQGYCAFELTLGPRERGKDKK